eukprot:scpid60685/ scgid24090/ 
MGNSQNHGIGKQVIYCWHVCASYYVTELFVLHHAYTTSYTKLDNRYIVIFFQFRMQYLGIISRTCPLIPSHMHLLCLIPGTSLDASNYDIQAATAAWPNFQLYHRLFFQNPQWGPGECQDSLTISIDTSPDRQSVLPGEHVPIPTTPTRPLATATAASNAASACATSTQPPAPQPARSAVLPPLVTSARLGRTMQLSGDVDETGLLPTSSGDESSVEDAVSARTAGPVSGATATPVSSQTAILPRKTGQELAEVKPTQKSCHRWKGCRRTCRLHSSSTMRRCSNSGWSMRISEMPRGGKWKRRLRNSERLMRKHWRRDG